MVFGMTLYTFIHVMISLVAIASGFVVVFGMMAGNRLDNWTSLFLSTTMATSITGFFFPFHGFKPSYVVGIISVIILTIAYLARYRHQLAGGWRTLYVITSVIALYLNFFVLIVQSFLKVPSLNALAPTQTEPPFKEAQTTALIAFIIIGAAAVRGFRQERV